MKQWIEVTYYPLATFVLLILLVADNRKKIQSSVQLKSLESVLLDERPDHCYMLNGSEMVEADRSMLFVITSKLSLARRIEAEIDVRDLQQISWCLNRYRVLFTFLG